MAGEGQLMTTAEWIAFASIAAVVVSAFAIVAALKGVRDQLRMTIFLAYTDRYTRAMNSLSFEARHPGSEYRMASLSDADRISALSVLSHRHLTAQAWSIHMMVLDRPQLRNRRLRHRIGQRLISGRQATQQRRIKVKSETTIYGLSTSPLTRIHTTLTWAQRRGKVHRNVADLVETPTGT